MMKTEYSTLWEVVSHLLLLSHGQASVERGFSINKQMERTNMCHETFIAERIVHDHMTSVGGVLSVTIDKQLLTSCRASRARYTAHCEDLQRARLTEGETKKRKCVIDEIDNLKSKRQHLETDITELSKCADDFSLNAEKTRDFSLVAKSNAMRRSAQEKHTELDLVKQKIDTAVTALKGI